MINRLASNTFGFIQWHKVTGADITDMPISDLNAIDLTAEFELTNNYRKSTNLFAPALLKSNNHTVYVNLDSRISDADFANWRVDLYDVAGNEIDTGLGTLVKNSVVSSDYRFHFVCNIDSGVANGIYNMVIFNTSTSSIKYISTCIEVISTAEIPKFTYIQYKNSTNIYLFDYIGVEDYNSFFLPMNMIEPEPESDLTQYRERSSGIIRNQKSQTAKAVKFDTYFFDEKAGDMMTALSVHDDIKVNGRVMTVKDGYKMEFIKEDNVHKGEIVFYDQKFSTINLHG